MCLDIFHQAVGIFAHAEEICFLLGIHDRAAAVRALAVHKLALGPEGLTGRAVLALVGALVDIALVIQLLEDLLHFLDMHRIGRPDKAVVGRVHQVPDLLDLACNLVDVLLRRDASGLGLLLDLLAVLVGAGLEVDVVPGHALVARDGIRQDDLIGVADVWLCRGIGNRRGDIIRLFIHCSLIPPKIAQSIIYHTGICRCNQERAGKFIKNRGQKKPLPGRWPGGGFSISCRRAGLPAVRSAFPGAPYTRCRRSWC